MISWVLCFNAVSRFQSSLYFLCEILASLALYQFIFASVNSTTKAHVAVLSTNVFFAVNYGLVKYISPSLLGAYGLNVIRVAVSLVLFWVVWMFSKTPAGIKKQHIGRFFLCGVTGVAINQTLFMKGLTLTSTIHASLLMLCTPLLITLFAFWILKERMTWLKAAGLAAGIGGAVLLVLSKDNGLQQQTYLLGDLLIVLNAFSYAFYFVLVKPLMEVYNPVHVVRWVFTFGFVMILPFGWNEFTAIDWSRFNDSHFMALAWIVLCGTFLAYLFNMYGIRYLGAGVTGSYIYTQPAFTAAIAIVFLNEFFTWQKLLAGLLIFAGVFLVGLRKQS